MLKPDEPGTALHPGNGSPSELHSSAYTSSLAGAEHIAA
jgi:hypothetical protein